MINRVKDLIPSLENKLDEAKYVLSIFPDATYYLDSNHNYVYDSRLANPLCDNFNCFSYYGYCQIIPFVEIDFNNKKIIINGKCSGFSNISLYEDCESGISILDYKKEILANNFSNKIVELADKKVAKYR